MGKKANIKKIVRELIKEKEGRDKKDKRKIKKELVKGIRKEEQAKENEKNTHEGKRKTKEKEQTGTVHEKERTRIRLSFNSKKIFGGALVLIMLSILVATGYLLFEKVFKSIPIAKYLPSDRTIAFLEINSNFNHNQLTKSFELLKDYPEYSKQKVQELLEKKLLGNYDNDINPWLGRGMGVAFLKGKSDEKSLDIIYFAEALNQNNAKRFIENKNTYIKMGYVGYEVYSSQSGENIAFVDSYIFYTQNKKAMEDLLNFEKSNEKSVFSSDKYSRISNNMPINKMAFLYVNFNQISEEFLRNIPLLKDFDINFKQLLPLMKLMDSDGMVLVAMNNKFAIQSFLNLTIDKVKEEKYIKMTEKYSANIAQYVGENAMAFYGGQNVGSQIKRIVEVLSSGKQEVVENFDKVLQNYTQKYFGSEVLFNLDIMPLLKNEYALAIENEGGKPIYKFFLELSDKEKDMERLEKIADNFAKIGGVFRQEVVEHILPDGTPSREIIAIPEAINKKSEDYKGIKVTALHVGEESKGFFYATIEDVAVISDSLAGIKNSIDLKENKNNLKISETFKKLIEPVLKNSDEISYFNLAKLLPNLPLPVSEISGGNNYFDDGIVSINYLHVK
ncbi:hypothetical protein COY05_01345 [Candidatus Peregrinibacteria bacterium CG_4_10_14_0_2_um_filter_38_24]|nr:MAG: hypothetical protein COY05_01345 [Candidatus Peregrinibacteria bacterium CG_4_10_14_0_2_um_filter_38_24]PJC39204.1 MAG: hypothetical protein CO044_00945 [Candidatus Peregrinibacteria bacterium CG_4_9_14_0_2_um_filter_38_9]